MKRVLMISLLFLIILTATAQPKTRGKVKRKYRNVERVSENLPQVIFRGLVRDVNKVPIPGASIEIEGINRLVHSNEFGQFMLSDLPTGRLRLKISCLGFRTKTIDYALKAGYNDHYLALDRERVHLEPLILTAQKREQHIQDIPTAVSGVTNSFADKYSMTGNMQFAGFHPKLFYEDTGSGRTSFSMAGSGSDAGFPGISSSVAVFTDEVPVMQPGGLSSRFFDFERIELMGGPQNVLFGRYALNGAMHLVTKKPVNHSEGYVTAGGGNFGTKEIRGALNMPLVKDKLAVRAAGIYFGQDGYVENLQGGMLNGENGYGGRLSVRFLPAFNHKLDINVNYLKNESSGIAFMNPLFFDEEGTIGLKEYRTALNYEDKPGSDQETMVAAFQYRYFLNEHDYWTVISSYQKSNTSGYRDADGTDIPALEVEDATHTALLHHEIRFNFSRKSRSNGSAGLSYSRETGNQQYNLASNDQLIYEVLTLPGNAIMPRDNRFPVNPHPLNPDPLSGIPLSGFHQEELLMERSTQSAQAYVHFTYRLRNRWFFTGGARGFYDRMHLHQESGITGGSASVLGTYSNSAPNLLYRPADRQELTSDNLSVTGQAGIQYRRHENFNFFVNAIRGRKPQVLLFSWDNKPLVLASERVNSAEAGWKAIIKQRVFWDVTGFYRRHFNVHAVQWGGSANNGLMSANGKATSYGAQTGLKASLINGVEVFGRYAWLRSSFDSLGVDGNDFLYAGNSFAQAPEHSFSGGMTLGLNLLPGMKLFATPWYSWKSHFWFTEANTPGIEQPAYGLLNLNFGLELKDPKVVISIYGTNLLQTTYISGAGHFGGLFGIPTIVPGQPRMAGINVRWSF